MSSLVSESTRVCGSNIRAARKFTQNPDACAFDFCALCIALLFVCVQRQQCAAANDDDDHDNNNIVIEIAARTHKSLGNQVCVCLHDFTMLMKRSVSHTHTHTALRAPQQS